jgi:hypothetical protein
MGERVRCVLLPRELNTDDLLRRLPRADYFLCPHDPEMGGYRLTSSGLSAERMSADDYRELVDALDPLISSRIRGLFMSSAESWARQSSHFAVVCTELEPREVHQDHDPWLRMLASYDRILAREVSMHADDCVVVRPVRNGYLLAFQRPRDAAAWARRLQFEVDWYNDQVARNASSDIPIPTHSIALGYGLVSRVLRPRVRPCRGRDRRLHRLAARITKGCIVMSRPFADQYEAHVGQGEFLAGTPEYDAFGRGLRVLDWP